MSDFHCPLCHAEIDHLDYTEEGTYALNPDGSFDDRGGCVNVGRVSCPACHGKLDWSLEDDVPTVCGAWRIDAGALREEVEGEVLGAGSAPGPDAPADAYAFDRMLKGGAEYYAWCYGEQMATFVEAWDGVAQRAGAKAWRDLRADERHKLLARDALSHFSADVDLTAEGWCERMEACMQDVCDKSLGR